MGQMRIFMWVPVNSENRSRSCSENCGSRIAQVVRCHSENGISHSQNQSLNSESCAEKTYPGTLRELGEWPFHSESVFPEVGVAPRLLTLPLSLSLPLFSPCRSWLAEPTASAQMTHTITFGLSTDFLTHCHHLWQQCGPPLSKCIRFIVCCCCCYGAFGIDLLWRGGYTYRVTGNVLNHSIFPGINFGITWSFLLDIEEGVMEGGGQSDFFTRLYLLEIWSPPIVWLDIVAIQ